MSPLRSALTVLVLFSASVASAGGINPMESVGEQHNLYLGCLQTLDPKGERNAFEVLVKDCGFEAGMPAGEFVETYSQLMPRDLEAPLDVMLKDVRGKFTAEQYSYLSRIESVLSSQSPEEAARALEALEAEAVSSLGGKAEDLAVLGGLATARYSLSFWQKNPPVAMKAKWWQVVLGDVAGGVVGGIFGGGVGAVGLGTACSQAVASL